MLLLVFAAIRPHQPRVYFEQNRKRETRIATDNVSACVCRFQGGGSGLRLCVLPDLMTLEWRFPGWLPRKRLHKRAFPEEFC